MPLSRVNIGLTEVDQVTPTQFHSTYFEVSFKIYTLSRKDGRTIHNQLVNIILWQYCKKEVYFRFPVRLVIW